MSIKGVFEWVTIFFPLVSGLISLVELKSGGGNGESKKAEVLAMLETLAKKVLHPSHVKVAMVLAPFVIDVLVTLANTTGVFTSSAAQ